MRTATRSAAPPKPTKPPAAPQLLVAVPRQELAAACDLAWDDLVRRGYRTIAVIGEPGRQFPPRLEGGAAQPGWDDWSNLALLRRGDSGPLRDRPILLQQNW